MTPHQKRLQVIAELRQLRAKAADEGHTDAVARELCRENLIRRGYSLNSQKDYLRAVFI